MSLSFSPFLENEAVSEGWGSETFFPKCLDAERISHWLVFLSLNSYPEPQTEWVELSTTRTICYSQRVLHWCFGVGFLLLWTLEEKRRRKKKKLNSLEAVPEADKFRMRKPFVRFGFTSPFLDTKLNNRRTRERETWRRKLTKRKHGKQDVTHWKLSSHTLLLLPNFWTRYFSGKSELQKLYLRPQKRFVHKSTKNCSIIGIWCSSEKGC